MQSRYYIKRFTLLHKIISFLLFFMLVGIFSVHFNIFGFKNLLYQNYPNLELRLYLFDKESVMEKFENDFNVKFLPKTQFLNLNIEKIKLNFTQSFNTNHSKSRSFKSFYLELLEDKIWIVDYLGGIYQIKIKDIKNKKIDNIDLKAINSNLSVIKVLDTLLDDEYLYVSFVALKNNCKSLNIAVAKINSQYLNFQNFFSSNECGEYIMGGRMQFYKHDSSNGLLLTTSNHPNNRPDGKPQNENSFFGKILFIDFEEKKPIIFSKGHRVAQGLYAEDNLIISTEHGPRGGDEINKIIFNKNYGWPISSYGEKYDIVETEKPHYFKSHTSLGFEEPIFAFVPSIGISEIIRLPNNFSDHFTDNFIISSLWGNSLYRIKFDENYDRIIFSEIVTHYFFSSIYITSRCN